MRLYWTCSDLADAIRGTDKPSHATAEDWDDWDALAQKKHPIRYWIAETGLSKLEDIITYVPNKIDKIRYYLRNRYIDHTHRLTASKKHIKPGDWCDIGYRFLPCLFTELQDYVEVEIAINNVRWMTDEDDFKKYNPPYKPTSWFNWNQWRNAEAGIDYLKWSANLTFEDNPTRQATDSIEILALYDWWINVYPNRLDPDDASGITEFYENRDKQGKFLSHKFTPEEKEIWDKCNNIRTEMINQYEREDEEMMIRLIKIRHALWT